MEVVHRELIARDGTRIGYQVRSPRASSPGAPCVVLANGLGATHLAYRGLMPALAQYTTIAWDYRGMFSSGAARDPRANTVAHQVDDLVEILAAEGIDELAIVGWSMGVQVALETVRRHPARVRGVFALNGTPGRIFRTAIAGFTLPYTLRLLRARAGLANGATRAMTASRTMFALAQRIGWVSGDIDSEPMREVFAQFGTIDWAIYADLLMRLDEHDADDVLPTITVPTTIVAGARDVITPRERSEYMHRRIRGSRLVVVPGGTHYTPIEYPREVAAELTRWLAGIAGWESVPDRAAVAR